VELGPEHALPSLHAELDDGPRFADLRMGWSERGLGLNLRVSGKKQPPWCRDARLQDSDGLSLWIDTRNTQTIHRAGRFCHYFIFLPQGGGARFEQPVAALETIERAREHPRRVDREAMPCLGQQRVDGYFLQAFIPAKCITGYEPAEHPRLGFSYAVTDRELGWQTFSLGSEYPFGSDPSLWGTLELVD
jgi:hypothetical protein